MSFHGNIINTINITRYNTQFDILFIHIKDILHIHIKDNYSV